MTSCVVEVDGAGATGRPEPFLVNHLDAWTPDCVRSGKLMTHERLSGWAHGRRDATAPMRPSMTFLH